MLDSLIENNGPTARLVYHLRRRVAAAGVDLLYPPRCACCDSELMGNHDELLLCTDCCRSLGPETRPCCPFCGAAGAVDGVPPERCWLCRKTRLKFDKVVPLGDYHVAELHDVVLRMKRPVHESLSAAMGRLLARRRRQQLAELRPDLIVPVPMYWTRRLDRGTNSPEILARELGRTLGIAVRRRVLWRCRNTLPQAGLPPGQRFQNVRGAFRVRSGRRLRGARVLLVDDILTTGATCSEAAKVLKKAGAAMVAVAVVARAQGPNTT